MIPALPFSVTSTADRIVSSMKKKLTDATEMTSRTDSKSSSTAPPPPPSPFLGGVEISSARGQSAAHSDSKPDETDGKKKSVKFTSTYAQDAHEALKRSLQLAENSNTHGEHAIASLGKQREVIQHSLNNVDETHEALRGSRRALREMKFAQWKEAGVKGLVILGLIGIILFIIYAKWGKKR